MMKKILFVITVVGSMGAAEQSYISRLYCKVLGNTDIKQEYKELAHRALQDNGISDPESVPVKKMNRVGSIVALMPVSSFTAFGLWFDEDSLDECSEDERTFQIYHEAAHYAKRHHQQVLIAGTAMSVLTVAGVMMLNKTLHAQDNPYTQTITAGTGVAAAAMLYVGVLPHLVKRQEREADMAASTKLTGLGSMYVYDRIKDLRRSKPSRGTIWWYSEKEQADYLEDSLRKYL
jgi:hypothetical protein